MLKYKVSPTNPTLKRTLADTIGSILGIVFGIVLIGAVAFIMLIARG